MLSKLLSTFRCRSKRRVEEEHEIEAKRLKQEDKEPEATAPTSLDQQDAAFDRREWMKELAKRDLCAALECDSDPNKREKRLNTLLEHVKKALSAGVDFNYRCSRHHAGHAHHDAEVGTLFSKCVAEIMWPVADNDSSHLIPFRLFVDQLRLVLQQQQVDVDALDGVSPCGAIQHFVARWLVHCSCDLKGRSIQTWFRCMKELFRGLLGASSDLNALCSHGLSVAMLVAETSIDHMRVMEVLDLLREHGADLNQRGKGGYTVLHFLSRNVDATSFRRLLETEFAGYDWTIRDDQGRTFAEVPMEYSQQLTKGYREIQDMNDLWNQRWTAATAVALEASTPLLAPLQNICLEYLTGKGGQFCSRKQQEETDKELAEFEAMIMELPTPTSELMQTPTFSEQESETESNS